MLLLVLAARIRTKRVRSFCRSLSLGEEGKRGVSESIMVMLVGFAQLLASAGIPGLATTYQLIECLIPSSL
jgi:hypothetical protein